jgi:hypothetical protein
VAVAACKMLAASGLWPGQLMYHLSEHGIAML